MKTMLTEAMRQTFDSEYVTESLRGIPISIEFPEERQSYPGIWVDFEPTGDLQVAGIDHAEYEVDGTSGLARRFTRWRCTGFAAYTVVALTSRERDALFDEVVRVFAFGPEAPSTSDYRRVIETNDLIALNMDFAVIGQRGLTSSPGTPWGSDEIVYEGTVAVAVIGEFVSDATTATLAKVTSILVTDLAEGQIDPAP